MRFLNFLKECTKNSNGTRKELYLQSKCYRDRIEFGKEYYSSAVGTDDKFHEGNYHQDLFDQSLCYSSQSANHLANDLGCYITGVKRLLTSGEVINGSSDFLAIFAVKRLARIKEEAAQIQSKKDAELTKESLVQQTYMDSPEYIRDDICKAKSYNKSLEEELTFHRKAGQRSGFVNATKMNELGLGIESNERYISSQISEYKKRSNGQLPDLKHCFSTQPKKEEQSEK